MWRRSVLVSVVLAWSAPLARAQPAVVSDFPFHDRTERTKASVPVTIGHQGGTVLLEKVGDRWQAIDIVNMWIS